MTKTISDPLGILDLPAHDALRTGSVDDGSRYAPFGGCYVSELLRPALEEVAHAASGALMDPGFQQELQRCLESWAGRPTPMTEAPEFGRRARLRVFLKREDLLHGGAHKTNNAVGQALLAKRMGKSRLLAETGAGQHGVATAMAGARLGLAVTVYMGAKDVVRQRSNVERMRLCGAEVIPVESGTGTLKDAINEALRDWVGRIEDTHYVLGSVCGPSPYPELVGAFHGVIGREARQQIVAQAGGLPDAAVACVGGGSNAIGLFRGFLDAPDVRLLGAEPGGQGVASGRHGATLQVGTHGLLHGARTRVLQDGEGQIQASHSISAGLDYPGVGPEHAFLQQEGRATYHSVEDQHAVEATGQLCRTEGILPALETAHALALVLQAVERELVGAGDTVVVNLSGRGDKDLETLMAYPNGGPS